MQLWTIQPQTGTRHERVEPEAGNPSTTSRRAAAAFLAFAMTVMYRSGNLGSEYHVPTLRSQWYRPQLVVITNYRLAGEDVGHAPRTDEQLWSVHSSMVPF